MMVSNCCGAEFGPPGWPDCDLCSACREHADAIDQNEPSINVIEMPELPDNAQEIFERIKNEKS